MSEFWRTVRKKEAFTVFAISGAEKPYNYDKSKEVSVISKQ